MGYINPLLALPASADLLSLSLEERRAIARILRQFRHQGQHASRGSMAPAERADGRLLARRCNLRATSRARTGAEEEMSENSKIE
ncbi:MAG TPA: hypothetical protein VM659_13725 [Dongiaceae bacterium]|nr:hypothetical protein [Dongiaceae bacterium]